MIVAADRRVGRRVHRARPGGLICRSKCRGRSIELPVNEGDAVQAGQLLARLDNADAAAAVSSAEDAVTQAEAAVQQAQADVLQAESGVAQAEAAVEVARGRRAERAGATCPGETRANGRSR